MCGYVIIARTPWSRNSSCATVLRHAGLKAQLVGVAGRRMKEQNLTWTGTQRTCMQWNLRVILCVPLFGSVLCATLDTTGSISEAERHACLMLLTCTDSVYLIIFPWFLCFYLGWVNYVVFLFVRCVFIVNISDLVVLGASYCAWHPVWLDLLCGEWRGCSPLPSICWSADMCHGTAGGIWVLSSPWHYREEWQQVW